MIPYRWATVVQHLFDTINTNLIQLDSNICCAIHLKMHRTVSMQCIIMVHNLTRDIQMSNKLTVKEGFAAAADPIRVRRVMEESFILKSLM
jgi:hypothetical protein